MMFQTQIAAHDALGLIPYIAAVVFAVGGVYLYLNTEEEDCFIETLPVFCELALKAALAHLDRLGFEPIPEDEEPPTFLENGSMRIYLVEKEAA